MQLSNKKKVVSTFPHISTVFRDIFKFRNTLDFNNKQKKCIMTLLVILQLMYALDVYFVAKTNECLFPILYV